VWSAGRFEPLQIEKTLTLSPSSDEVRIDYTVTSDANAPLALHWACEWNLALSAWTLPERHYHSGPRTPRSDLLKWRRSSL
jgi:hypothetical protein